MGNEVDVARGFVTATPVGRTVARPKSPPRLTPSRRLSAGEHRPSRLRSSSRCERLGTDRSGDRRCIAWARAACTWGCGTTSRPRSASVPTNRMPLRWPSKAPSARPHREEGRGNHLQPLMRQGAAATYATRVAGFGTTTTRNPMGASRRSSARRFAHRSLQPDSGDDIVLAKVPAGYRFAFSIINGFRDLRRFGDSGHQYRWCRAGTAPPFHCRGNPRCSVSRRRRIVT